jgi:hypothetical protein
MGAHPPACKAEFGAKGRPRESGEGWTIDPIYEYGLSAANLVGVFMKLQDAALIMTGISAEAGNSGWLD